MCTFETQHITLPCAPAEPELSKVLTYVVSFLLEIPVSDHAEHLPLPLKLQKMPSPYGGFPPNVLIRQCMVISQALGAAQVIPGLFCAALS